MQSTIKKKNSNRLVDMTVGNPYKLITTFAIPLFFSQMFQQLYNTADTFIVGKFLGTNALAAVSSSGTLIFLLVSFFSGTASGAGVVISRYFGSGDKDKVMKAIYTNLIFGAFSGLLLTIVGVAFTPTFLRLMKTDVDVLTQAIEYFRYYFLGALAVVMYNICISIMNALGNSKKPLYYLIVSSILNVVLDLLFIAVFKWGVWSAAFATVIAEIVSVVLCFIDLTKADFEYRVRLKDIKFDKDTFKEIIRYGLPSGVQNSVIGFANVIVQSQINSFGKFATAGYGTHAKIEGFAFSPITSFNMAMTTFIGQNLGAKQYDRAKKGSVFGISASMLLAEIIGVIYYIFAPVLIGSFDVNKNPEVIGFGVEQARIVALFYFLLAFSHAIAAVCRGAGKAFVPMGIMLAIWCIFRIIYIITVMHFVGDIKLVYWAYPLTWAISSVIYLCYYLFSDWIYGFDKKSNKLSADIDMI